MDDGLSDRAFQLLADWWMTTVQALVDSAGSEGAVNLLRPHCLNGALAAGMNLKKALDLKEGDFVASAFATKVGAYFFLRSPDMTIEIKRNGFASRMPDCPFKHGPSELCEITCGIVPTAYAQVFRVPEDQSARVTLTSRLTKGDPECVWIGRREPGETRLDPDDLGETTAVLLNWEFPKEMIDSYSVQYLGEYWVMAVKALSDHLGPERSTSVLAPYMRHSGISYGLKCAKSPSEGDNGLNRIVKSVGECNEALEMRSHERNPLDPQRTIAECPFRDAPPEVCAQFEAFCKGICEGIDPRYEFSYDRMMSKGDERCHWTIRLKGKGTLDAETKLMAESRSDESPLALFKRRLAKGEISKEEYLELKELLE